MFVSGIATAFRSGELRTFFVIAAPLIGSAVTYFGRTLHVFVIDFQEDARTRFTYWRSRRTLVKMRKERGISAGRHRELSQDIEELDRLFVTHVKKRVSAQLGEPDRPQ
ncbi:MAG: hypothetical protein M3Q10_05765 [Chloroflexota bacterium]|nr:hypothetical protein [Chloroflexota bacterium]